MKTQRIDQWTVGACLPAFSAIPTSKKTHSHGGRAGCALEEPRNITPYFFYALSLTKGPLQPVVVEADMINAESTILLLKKVEEHYPSAPHIYVFSDNARYYHSEEVAKYLRTSRILLEKIPPYSPNLNPIERLWKFFHKQIHYNKYYETFSEFRLECLMFFERLDEYAEKLSSLITLNFKVLDGINAKMKPIS
ncbi:MAG: transposase [Lentisphaerota bacterium]